MSIGADVPETLFADALGDQIAYQVFGQGPTDLLWMAPISNCIDARWEYPPLVSFMRRLGSFSRVLMFDRRGTGASDPVPLEALPTWEDWAEDALAVLDAVGSARAAIFATNDAGPSALLFAAAHPNRTSALILANSFARMAEDDGYPEGVQVKALERLAETTLRRWGRESWSDLPFRPQTPWDPDFRRWTAKSQRMSCSPREAAAYNEQAMKIDVRHVLPSLRVPTLVINRERHARVELGRYLAEHIPDARLVLVEGDDFLIFTEPNAEVTAHIEKFLTGAEPTVDSDRALITLLFTDIVGSTQQASRLGDVRWRSLLDSHDAVTKTIVDRHRGRVMKLTGDGALITFDGPGRALRCAFGLRDALEPLGITLRAGVHSGEVELRTGDVGGLGVHVAARVLEHAGPGEVLASAAVPLLVAGSDIEFEDRGEHELKGVPGSWKLFAVKG